MRFSGDYVMVIRIKLPGARIIPQHRHHPGFLFLQRQCGVLNTGFKKIIDDFGLSGFEVRVFEQPAKGIMISVIASGLGNILKLYVSGIGQPDCCPGRKDVFILKISPDYGDIIGV